MSEVTVVNQPSVPATTPAQLLQIAVEKNADMDQLQKMMELQIKWEENEARKAFYRAMTAFTAEVPVITKDSRVGFQSKGGSTNYNHASLGNIVRTIQPILGKHGLSFSWTPEQNDNREITIHCDVSHVDGYTKRVSLTGPRDDSGKKNSLQQINSTQTYLERYTLTAALGLATGEEDDDGRGSVALISHDQAEEIVKLMHEGGLDPAKFMAYLKSKGYESVGDIPADKFDSIIAVIERSAKNKAEAESGDSES